MQRHVSIIGIGAGKTVGVRLKGGGGSLKRVSPLNWSYTVHLNESTTKSVFPSEKNPVIK